MTAQEEQLVLDLHAKWGNRWSRIARKLPGRTDNEIKNYWRTHMRKKAQEEKNIGSTSAASATRPSSPSFSSTVTTVTTTSNNNEENEEAMEDGYNSNSVDQYFWNEIAASETAATELGFDEYNKEIGCYPNLSCDPIATPYSPAWEYNPEPLWRIDDEEFSEMIVPDLAHS